MFKYHKGILPKSVCVLFILNNSNHSYNKRNKDKIRSAYGKHKFMYRNFRFISVHAYVCMYIHTYLYCKLLLLLAYGPDTIFLLLI